MVKTYDVVSLFSCCGGLDLGFKGGFTLFGDEYKPHSFRIVHASDIDKRTVETYNHNFKNHSQTLDINDLNVETLPPADVVIGGFPCQPFSLSGKREGFEDTKGRGTLYLQMKRVIEHLQPKIFIAENVDGLRSKKTGTDDTTALDEVIREFSEIGYTVQYKKLHAVDYGVPQTRVRIIIVGIRNDLDPSAFSYPEPTHGEHTGIPYRTIKDAIDDLWELLDDPNAPSNHTSKDYSKAKFFPGKNYQGNQREQPDKPAHTVRAEAHGNQYGHYRTTGDNTDNPDMNTWRRLTVRESARIQTFPDSFEFPVSQSAAHHQIGNAVPPLLAWHIANSVEKFLNQVTSN